MFRLRLRSICPERTQKNTFSRLNIIPAIAGTKLFSIFLAFALPGKMKKSAQYPCAYFSSLTVILCSCVVHFLLNLRSGGRLPMPL